MFQLSLYGLIYLKIMLWSLSVIGSHWNQAEASHNMALAWSQELDQAGRHVTLLAKGMWEKCVWEFQGKYNFYVLTVLFVFRLLFLFFFPSLSGEPLASNSLFCTLQLPKYWPGTSTSMRKVLSYAEGQWQENFREELEPVD